MSDRSQTKIASGWSYAYLAALTVATMLLVRGTQSISTDLDGDSGNYLFTAQSIIEGAGITKPSGEALTIFPPGYPLALAAIGSLGIEVTTAATVINLIVVALMVPGTYLLTRMTIGGQLIPLIAATIFATSAAIIRVFSNAWTEPLFMVLMLAVLILLVQVVKTKSLSWPVAFAIAILISLATTLRFVGLFMIPVVIISLWLATKPKIDYLKISITGAVALVGFTAVGLRNVSLGVPLMGERSESALTLQGALEGFARQLGVYVAPPDSTSLTNVAGALLLAALIAGMWLVFIRRERSLYPVALFFFVFWSGILWSQTSTRIDVNPERLGSPAFVAVIVLGLYVLTATTQTLNNQLSLRINRQQLIFGQMLFAVVVIAVIALNLVNSLRLLN
jgi:hypothetical protein